MAEDGDKESIRITRIDRDLRDLLAIAEAEVGPGFAGVAGFVDAIADGEVGAMQAFTRAGVDDVGIGWSDGERADGAGGLVVEDGDPGAAVVVGLEDSAVDLRDVEDVGLRRDTGRGAGASAAQGSDGSPAEFGEELGVVGLGEGEGGNDGEE